MLRQQTAAGGAGDFLVSEGVLVLEDVIEDGQGLRRLGALDQPGLGDPGLLGRTGVWKEADHPVVGRDGLGGFILGVQRRRDAEESDSLEGAVRLGLIEGGELGLRFGKFSVREELSCRQKPRLGCGRRAGIILGQREELLRVQIS